MGEAKRRGTFEQRKAQAIELRKRLRNPMPLSETTKARDVVTMHRTYPRHLVTAALALAHLGWESPRHHR